MFTGNRARMCIVGLATFLALAVLFSVYVVFLRPRVIIDVENVGTEKLQAVVVHVTGKSYLVGDILPGQQTSLEVHPTSKSHVEIEFIDKEQVAKRINADVYFAANDYDGKVAIKVDSQGLVDLRNEVHPTKFPWP